MASTTDLAHFDRARHHLEAASTIDEVKAIHDQAEALRQYARQSKQSLEMQNQCAIIKLRAERKAGVMLAAMPREPGERTDLQPETTLVRGSEYQQSLNANGIAGTTAKRWQAVAAVPAERFEAHLQATVEAGEELTTARLLRVAHVSHASGENEWYTPSDYIEAARRVLGKIELDPASSVEANTCVQAERFYTAADDGLEQPWSGTVWLNPPYQADLVGQFCDKLLASPDVLAALVLVNNATETRWFQRLAKTSQSICFPERRVRFWSPGGVVGAPLQGQAVIYLGPASAWFAEQFRPFGVVVTPS